MSVAGWSVDICLTCDKQIDEGVYCSDSCRLVDQKRGQSPTSPASNEQASSIGSTSSSSSGPAASSAFWMTPINNSKAPGQASPTKSKYYSARDSQDSTRSGSQSSSRLVLDLDTSNAQHFTLDPPSTSSLKTPSRKQSSNISAAAREELRRYDDAFENSSRRRDRKSSRS